MQLLYISTFMFYKKGNKTLALPSCSDVFFEKYLDIFDSVKVLGEEIKSYLDPCALIELSNPKIQVDIIPKNTNPRDFKNDNLLKQILSREISRAEAILIKPSSRKGMLAINVAELYKKPYMIEMTGDIHNALMRSSNILRRLYSPILYNQIRRKISKCKFGLYVTQSYLQQQYPIEGRSCGCSDVDIGKLDFQVMEDRIMRIERTDFQSRIDLALVGFYQGTGKGVDVAIKALSRLDDRFHLSILGNGTEENRKHWLDFGKKKGVFGRIHFPDPLPSTRDVILWLKTMDIFILPTRSEGLCRAVLEAMSTALPCIVTDVCSMPELISDEWRHAIGDYKGLSDRIKKMASDKSLMIKAARENFNKASEYEYDKLRERRNIFLNDFKNYCSNC